MSHPKEITPSGEGDQSSNIIYAKEQFERLGSKLEPTIPEEAPPAHVQLLEPIREVITFAEHVVARTLAALNGNSLD